MQLIEALSDLCSKSPSIIAIDGPAGAGKTTLSGELKRVFAGKRVEVVHLDELYNGWDHALSPELTEKLLALVSDFINGQRHTLDIYDWQAQAFTSKRVIAAGDLLIVEGVGAGQSALRPFYSALIWIDIDDSSGLARVLARDGTEIAPQMQQWQIAQRAHFSAEKTRENSDFELTT